MNFDKKILYVFIACSAILLNIAFAEQVGDVNNNAGSSISAERILDINAPKPKIVFENKIVDFGKIGPQTRVTGEFRFRNTGNADLEIAIKGHRIMGIQPI